jgi:hypothetical protein
MPELQVVLWALLTGMVTGGAWVGIVLVRHQRRLARLEPPPLDDVYRRLDELEGVGQRLAEIEDRVDFAERLLAEERAARPLPPAGG